MFIEWRGHANIETNEATKQPRGQSWTPHTWTLLQGVSWLEAAPPHDRKRLPDRAPRQEGPGILVWTHCLGKNGGPAAQRSATMVLPDLFEPNRLPI